MNALLIGKEPGYPLGYTYVQAPPYDAVVIGSIHNSSLETGRIYGQGVIRCLCPAAKGFQHGNDCCHTIGFFQPKTGDVREHRALIGSGCYGQNGG